MPPQLDPKLDALLRAEFERMHAGRDLSRHRLRGTYLRPPIAALWNQHVRTYLWAQQLHDTSKEPVDAGWKEASVAWKVCASIHEKYGKGRDALYSTRQADYQKHSEQAMNRALALPPSEMPLQVLGLPVVIDDTVPPGTMEFRSGRRRIAVDIDIKPEQKDDNES